MIAIMDVNPRNNVVLIALTFQIVMVPFFQILRGRSSCCCGGTFMFHKNGPSGKRADYRFSQC